MIEVFVILVTISISLIVGSYVGMKLTSRRFKRDFHVISGKDAERFYKEINDEEVSDKQKVFLENCLKQLNEYEEIK